MSMKRFFITIICVLSLVNSYSNNNDKGNLENEFVVGENQYKKLMDLAETYLKENPEYAFICLYKAQSIAEESGDIRRMIECNTMMGDIFVLNNSSFTAISYYEKAAEDLIQLGDYVAACKMYTKIARLYQNGEFENKWIADVMNKALKYAKESGDATALNEVYITFGDIYSLQNEYDKSIEYYDKVLKNEIDKNTINLISTTLTKKASTLIDVKEYDWALALIDSSLYMCIREFNDSLQVINYSLKANIYDSIDDFESAKKYYMQSAKLAYSIDDFTVCGENMFSLACLNQREKKYDEAIDVFRMICDSTEKYRMYDICQRSYYQMSNCYALLGKYEEAYLMFNKHDYFHNIMNDISQEERTNKLRNGFILSLNIKELKSKEWAETTLKHGKIRWIVFVSIIIVLIMLLVIFLILYLNYKTMFNKNKEATYEQELKINMMENDLMEYQLKNNRETLINLALYLKSYIELINLLKEDLKQTMELPDNEQKNKVKKIYMSIQNHMQNMSNTDNLNKQIEAVYMDFLNRLDEKLPYLTKSEKKLCIMLFTNMSSKEIAVLTNTTIRSVETSRYRLRKKIGLSRDEDIVCFLQRL